MPSQWYGQKSTFGVFGAYKSGLAASIQGALMVKDDVTDTIVRYYSNTAAKRADRLYTKAFTSYYRGVPTPTEDTLINSYSLLGEAVTQLIELAEGAKITLWDFSYGANSKSLAVMHYLKHTRGMTSGLYKIITTPPDGVPAHGVTPPYGQPNSLTFNRYSEVPDSRRVLIYYRLYELDQVTFTEYVEDIIIPQDPGKVVYGTYAMKDIKDVTKLKLFSFFVNDHPELTGLVNPVQLPVAADNEYYPIIPVLETIPVSPSMSELQQTDKLIEMMGISGPDLREDVRREHMDFIVDGCASVHLFYGFDPCIGITNFSLIGETAPSAEELQATLRYAIEFFEEHSAEIAASNRSAAGKIITWDVPYLAIQMVFKRIEITELNSSTHAVGQCWSTCTSIKNGRYHMTEREYWDDDGMPVSGVPLSTTDVPIHYYIQISPTTCKRVSVFNLNITTDIPRTTTRRLEVKNEDRAVQTRIPMSRGIVRRVPVRQRDALLNRALCITSNSCIREEYEWYQSEEFGLLLKVVAVVITVLSLGKTYKLLTAAFAVGVLTFARVLIFRYITYMLFKALAKQLIKAIGLEGAYIVALLGMAYGKFGNFGAWESEFIMSTSSTLWGETTSTMQDRMKELAREQARVEDQMQLLQAELDKVKESLDNSSQVNPMIFQRGMLNYDFSMAPEDYIDLTLDTGKSLRLLNLPNMYYPFMLRLPTAYETLTNKAGYV